MAALAGTETIVTQTASGSVIAAAVAKSLDVALLANANPARAVNAISAGSGTTLTAAFLIGGVINRTGPSAAFSDALDSAANIVSALPANTPISASWTVYIRNLTPWTQTLTAGSGVSLSGSSVVPPNSALVAQVSYTGAATVSFTGLMAVQLDAGMLEADTAISTVGAGTLTAAGIAGGVITRSGSTSAFSDATDTAAAIIAALPNSFVGQSWELSLINTTAFAETVTAGSGVTLAGLAGPVPANSTGRYLVTYTGAGAVTMKLMAVAYNAASGFNPPSAQTEFGSGTGTFRATGLLNEQVSSTGINPGATAADNVLAAYTLPANSFDAAGRTIGIEAVGSFAANGNAKRLKIILNPASAVVGSTVGASGVTVADSGSTNQNAGGWVLRAKVAKYGAAGSNTQIGTQGPSSPGTTIAPALATATESGTILVAVTGNAATTATDIVFNQMTVTGSN